MADELQPRTAEVLSTIATVTGDDVHFVPADRENEFEGEIWDVRGSSGERYGALIVSSRQHELNQQQIRLYNQLSQILADEIDMRREHLSLEERFRLVDRQNAELSAVNRALSEMAYRDPLTGLFRRWYLDEQFRLEFSRSTRYGRLFSVLILDIDRFKDVNDTWGHAAGDAALKVVSRILQQSVRNSDVLCRYGGDEFCALLSDTGGVGAMEVAERIRCRCEEAIVNWESEQIRITVSIGLGSFGEGESSLPAMGADEVFERIDKAMYAAKKSGRNAIRRLEAVTSQGAAESGL